ncbi:amidase [Ruegeria pomeroyi]|nr:amidase [Ruegeria pomeroyi]
MEEKQMRPIWQWSAVETADAIRASQLTSQEVVIAHVERMRAVNPAINAITVDLGEEAKIQAQKADKSLANGEQIGPLHGVPITLKHNVDVQGQANSSGVPALRKNVARENHPVVDHFAKAGAIVIGLTNTPEFSFRAFTDNPLFGLTRNPWDRDITCGGSSGGAGAAVAAGIGTIAHGNDIGGSLRFPAHFNGVVTMRPTLGRVPHYNATATAERPIGMQLFSVQGPLARTVADVRLALDIMSARDPRDPWWTPAKLGSETQTLPIRVARAKIDPDMNASPRIVEEIDKAASWLEAEGYQVDEVEVPSVLACWENWWNIIFTEMFVLLKDNMLANASDDFARVFSHYQSFAETLDLPGYMTALAQRSAHLREWLVFLEEYPVVLAPTFAGRSPSPTADVENAEQTRTIFRNGSRYIGIANYLGLPAAVVPTGLIGDHPASVQLIGSRYSERTILDAADAIEKHAGILTRRLWRREDENEQFSG